MLKIYLFICLLVLLGTSIAAGQKPKIEYFEDRDAISRLLREAFETQGVQFIDFTLTDPAVSKKTLTIHVVKNGEVVTKNSQPFGFPDRDVEMDSVQKINVVMAITRDSILRIKICTDKKLMEFYCVISRELAEGIPMETYVENSSDTLPTPLFAYTNGIRRSILIEGTEHTGYDYCGLRNQKIHPALWAKDLELKDYVYFTLE